MSETETLEDFYKIKFSDAPLAHQKGIGDFDVFAVQDVVTPLGEIMVKYTRRDYYKICLSTGSNLFHYADKTIKVDGTALIFFNPHTPYRWEPLADDNEGFFCIFRPSFFTEKMRGDLGALPMFAAGGKPFYILDEAQTGAISDIFSKMMAEMASDFKYKQDLLLSYVTELVYYALKLEPANDLSQTSDARSRITALFTDLLERQFPISPQHRFALRSAKDFAEHLYLHVNYLNDAIKATTGKTTTKLIAERLATEARILLKHTNWNVSEIGYALGFEDAAHFNNFFKKHVALSPAKFRAHEAELVG